MKKLREVLGIEKGSVDVEVAICELVFAIITPIMAIVRAIVFNKRGTGVEGSSRMRGERVQPASIAPIARFLIGEVKFVCSSDVGLSGVIDALGEKVDTIIRVL